MMFLADEGVDKPIVDALRADGFEVAYILETHPGSDDDSILTMAESNKLILITMDKDFGELVFRLKRIHSGIVLIRLAGYSPAEKAAIVSQLLKEHIDELPGSFTVIQPNAIRIRK